MKNKVKFISVLGNLLMLITFGSSNVFACLCEPISVKQRVKLMKKEADAIFVGTVKSVSVENEKPGGTSIHKVVLLVEKSWKAEGVEEYTIHMYGGCRVEFEEGKSYLVYAKNNEKNQLITEICWGTRGITLATKDIKILGKPVL